MHPVRHRALLVVVVALLVGGSGGAAAALDQPQAPRAAAHVAAVTVDFGNGTVVHRTVPFAESSISGLDALRRAGFTVDVYGFSGIGGAVCRIDGVGRPADTTCLSGGDDYWGYYRNGVYSRVGAAATKVQNHDQEQWKWGTGGAAPPTTAFPSATTRPVTTRPATTHPATTRPTGVTRPTATTRPPGGGVVTTAVPGPPGTGSETSAAPGSTVPGAATTTTRPGATTTTQPGATTTTGRTADGVGTTVDGGGDGGQASAAAGVPGSPGGTDEGSTDPPGASILGFAAVLAVFGALIFRARRRRLAAQP